MDFLQLQIVGATLGCGIQASHCGDFSCCRARALSPWASVVVAPGLSCSTECGIFPDQGLNPCPLHWQADSYSLYHRGSARQLTLLKKLCVVSMEVHSSDIPSRKPAAGSISGSCCTFRSTETFTPSHAPSRLLPPNE